MRLQKYYDKILYNFAPSKGKLAYDEYCDFLDQFSDCLDDMIQNSDNEKLINEALKLYFRHNELYFNENKTDEECVEYLIDDFECFPDILRYDYNMIIVCNVCNGQGDLPECVNCGKTEIIEGNCPYCNKDTLVQGGYCEECNRWYDEYNNEYKEYKNKYKCDVCLDGGQIYGCSKCNKVDPEKCKECNKNFSFNNIYCRTCLEKIKHKLEKHAKLNAPRDDNENCTFCKECKCYIENDMYEQHNNFVHKYKSCDSEL